MSRYCFPAGQTGLSGYTRMVFKELPLALVIYHMSSLTKDWFDIEAIEKLARHSKIIGIKDSSGDIDFFRRAVGLKKLRLAW